MKTYQQTPRRSYLPRLTSRVLNRSSLLTLSSAGAPCVSHMVRPFPDTAKPATLRAALLDGQGKKTAGEGGSRTQSPARLGVSNDHGLTRRMSTPRQRGREGERTDWHRGGRRANIIAAAGLYPRGGQEAARRRHGRQRHGERSFGKARAGF